MPCVSQRCYTTARRADGAEQGWAFTALHDRYGKVVRVGKNEATICECVLHCRSLDCKLTRQ